MSLVNDVLRQLDSGSSAPQKLLPLHPMTADEPVRKKQIIRVLFSTVVVFLLLVIILQIFYKESIVDIFTPNKSAEIKQVEAVISQEKERLEKVRLEPDILEPKLIKIDSPVVSNAQNKTAIAASKVESRKIENSKIESSKAERSKLKEKTTSLEKALVNKPEQLEQPKTNVQLQTQAPKQIQAREFQSAKIKTVENPGFKEYQLALRSYKNKQNITALSWIDEAIVKDKKDEYLRLKVRILSQLGNGEELRQFVLNNNDNTSLAWFQLVAPSLQISSYYELSNAYYSELVRQQPNEVKWKLAMALNYSKLGLDEKTYSTYKDLLGSALLTNKQKKWIASRLERIEQGGGVSNES